METKSEDHSYFEYQTNFIKDPNHYFEKLCIEVQFEQRKVKVFGKYFDEPRLTAMFSDNKLEQKYVYSKSERTSLPMTPTLIELQKLVEERTKIHFDFVFLNFYRNGNDKVGWHSDLKGGLDPSNVASLSFGGERVFKFRDKKTKKVIWKETLKNGSLVWMKNGCQEEYEHEVPKSTKIVKPRINLTFRKFLY